MATKNDKSHDDSSSADFNAAMRSAVKSSGLADNSWLGFNLPEKYRGDVDGIWTAGTNYVQTQFTPTVERHLASFLQKYQAKGLPGADSTIFTKFLGKPALYSTILFGLLAAAPQIPMFYAPVRRWQKERHDLTKEIAPVLAEMKQDDMPHSLGSIDATDNEVIYAARARINHICSHKMSNAFLRLAPAAASTAIGKVSNALGNKAGVLKEVGDALNPGAGHGKHGASAQGPVALGVLLGTKMIGEFVNERNEEFAKEQNACSALDMIIELNKQLKKRDPKEGDLLHSEFTYPGALRRRSDKLATYIANIIETQSAEMERLKPEDYNHLRSTLKPQVQEVSKVLAEAIAGGDIAPLSLVRLIGEGHVIKQQGRHLVDAEELRTHLSKHASKQAALVDIDPKDYLGMASFKEKELKDTLTTLEGTERTIFASLFPDAVLKKAGLKDDEIKTIREETGPMYEKNLANLVVATANQPAEELKKLGMADTEIKAIQSAAKAVEEKGTEAIHSVRANAANPTGIELPLLNAAMAKISEPHYFGKMLSTGNELLSEGAKAANDDTYERESEGEGEGEGHRMRPRHNHEHAEQHERADHGKYTRQHRERSARAERSEHGESHGSHRA